MSGLLETVSSGVSMIGLNSATLSYFPVYGMSSSHSNGRNVLETLCTSESKVWGEEMLSREEGMLVEIRTLNAGSSGLRKRGS